MLLPMVRRAVLSFVADAARCVNARVECVLVDCTVRFRCSFQMLALSCDSFSSTSFGPALFAVFVGPALTSRVSRREQLQMLGVAALVLLAAGTNAAPGTFYASAPIIDVRLVSFVSICLRSMSRRGLLLFDC